MCVYSTLNAYFLIIVPFFSHVFVHADLKIPISDDYSLSDDEFSVCITCHLSVLTLTTHIEKPFIIIVAKHLLILSFSSLWFKKL